MQIVQLHFRSDDKKAGQSGLVSPQHCYKQSYTKGLTNAALQASNQLVFTSTTNIRIWTVEMGLNYFTREWPNGFKYNVKAVLTVPDSSR